MKTFTGNTGLRVCLLFLVLGAASTQGFWAPVGIELPNFDKRATGAETSPQADSGAAIQKLQALVPDLRIDFDPRTGTPNWITAPEGYLSGPGGNGRALTGVAIIDPNESHQATKAFLSEYQPLFGFGPEALDAALVTQDSVTAHNGLRTVVWQQQLGGISVFQGLLISHTTKYEELVSLSSHFVPDPAKAADAGTPNRAIMAQQPPIDAAKAIALASANVGDVVAETAVTPATGAPEGAELRQQFYAPPLNGTAEAKLVWLPMNLKSLRLCWEVVLTSRARSEMYRLVVDAQNGEVLLRHRLTEYLSDASYRIFPSDSPSPFSPGCPTPCTTQPPLVSRTLVTWGALDTNASPNGWIDDGVNETRGNNVDAHTDRNNDNLPDLPRPQGVPFRVFDFPIDFAQSPLTYTNAAVTELFYWNNWMHDRLYELGFTEAARNFQGTNFGRGGLGNDAVQADAQDGGGFNNANFSTPSDGSPGRMQMYIFDGPNPDRDGDLDHEVVLHEYTHGLSNRRVGGGALISALQTRGMGEGWSDWYAMTLLSEPADDVNGVYAAGGYATYLLSGMNSNYFFGIRRYPYCTDMTKNPLTFKDIDPGQASTHSGIPRSGIIGTTADEVHNQGEVWCVTLWEARAKLITKYGYATGNQLILLLVTDGMNLSPVNPNFLQARDAILQADVVDNGGANLPELWSAFAKRGMGKSATSPSSSTTVGLVEAYDVPDSLSVTPGTGFTSSGAVGGPFNPTSQGVTLINIGTNAISWGGGRSAGWLNLSQTSGSLAVGASNLVTVSLDVSAYALAAGIYNNTVTFTNLSTGITQSRLYTLRVGQPDYFTELFDTGDNDLDFQTLTFTPDGSANFYSVCREPASAFPTDPTAGTSLPLGAHTYMQLTTPSNIFLYGRSTNVIFLASEGHLTLGSGDSSGSVTLVNHFSKPRVSASLAHIHPTENGGTVIWQTLSNRVAITFNKVVEYATSNTNSFQIELFYDGRIRMTHLFLGTTTGLVGLSAGNGVPSGFIESDLDTYGPCAIPSTVTVQHNAREGDGVLTGAGQIRINTAATTNVTFQLSSSDTLQATVPATVTLLAGQLTTNFDITIIDDSVLDGPQPATISASAPGYVTGADTIIVSDNETAILSVTLPPEVTEGAPPVAGTVTASAAPSANITISLVSSDTNAVRVPATVVLPAGQTSVGFNATIINDIAIDGDQSATITAHVDNWTDGFATVMVHDNEPTNLQVLLPVSAREGDGVLSGAGTVRIFGTLTTNLPVTLLSSDTTELTVPPTVTILAGQTNATFDLTVIDDTEVDGAQIVTVTASASGFSAGGTNMIVYDNESPPPPSNPSPAHLATNVNQTISLSWSSGAVPGEVISNDVYFGTSPTLGAGQLLGTTTNTTWTLPLLSPLTTYYWQVVARKTAQTAGPVWQFTTRGVDHFVWDAVSSPQYVSQPFSVKVTAKDEFENTVSNFTGTASLVARGGGGGTGGPLTILYFENVNNHYFKTALDQLGLPYQMFTYSMSAAFNTAISNSNPNTTLVVFDAASTFNDFSAITSFVNSGGRAVFEFWDLDTQPAVQAAFQVSVAADMFTPQPVYDWGNSPLFAGLPSPVVFVETSWGDDGDFLNAVTGGLPVAGFVSGPTSNQGAIVIGNSGRTILNGFLMDDAQSPSNAVLLAKNEIQLLTGAMALPLTPTNSGNFTDGTWTGSVAVLQPATNVTLIANDVPGHTGTSNPFDVLLQNDISVRVTDTPDPVALGGNITYAITVNNTGPASATSVVVTNVLDPNAALVSASPSQGTVVTNGNVIICSLGSLSGSGSATVNIVARAMAAGSLSNQVTVSRGEPDPYDPNNSAVSITSVQTPTIGINDVSAYEGNSGTSSLVFTITVAPAPALPVSLSFATANGTAIAPSDYVGTNGTLTFAPGETAKSLPITIIGDTAYEFNETFYVNLSSATNATIADSQGVGTILNDDPVPTLSINDVTLAEGNTGVTNAVFAVSLSALSGVDASFTYTTANGTATAGSDYVARSGSLTIPAGIGSTNIAVSVNGDLTIEQDEVFYVDLTSSANANLLKREGYCLILNDDGLPGQLDHFVWSTIGPTQYVGAPFSATITALDYFNNPVTNFSGVANLSATASGSQGSNSILGNITYSTSSSGNYTLGYSFTPNANLTVTHVRSFFGTKVSIWTDSGSLLVSQTVSGSLGTWTETALGSPVTLLAGNTYRVAAYTAGSTYYWRTDGSNTFANGSINASLNASGDGFPTVSDSAHWWLVDLRYSVGTGGPQVAISPSVTGPFTGGTWTGNLTALAPGTNFVVRADDGAAHSGQSNPFVVGLRDDISLTMTDTPDPVGVGGNITYSIVVTNVGPSSATGVTVTNVLPATATFVSANSSQGSSTTNGNVVACSLGSLGPNTSATITIVATANTSGSVTNRATVYRNEADALLSNNSVTNATSVQSPVLSINSISVGEGNSGTTPAAFSVTLSIPAVTAVSVNFATTDGTAVAGSDYIATNGVLNFAPGQTNQPIVVNIIGDTNVEANETFSVILSAPIGASLGNSTGIGTILNDDLPPGPTNVLTQGPLTVVLSNSSAGIISVMYQGNEIYRYGTFISDWGLQTGTNSATFVRNANGSVTGQPMTVTGADSRNASYVGTYTTGGANVALTRNYSLVSGADLLRTSMTFRNNGTSSITLRYFETFDVDWLVSGVGYVLTANDRYFINTNGASIQVGRSIMTNGPLVVMLGTVEPGAILAAVSTSYFGITASTYLNSFFTTAGADSNGGVFDDTLDIGKEFILAPAGTASFVFYQSISTNVSSAEQALISNLAVSPLRFFAPVQAGNSLQVALGTSDGSPISSDRASRIRFYSTTNVSLPFSNWTLVTNPVILNSGTVQIMNLDHTNSLSRFFRATEVP